ncbi:MAG: hypothetical protein ABR555_00830, partial [Pyrinomonadaceae bacterium]
ARCYTDGHTTILEFDNVLLRLDQSEEPVVQLWVKRCPPRPDATLAHATSFAVCSALRRCGLFELHSAGVVTPDNNSAVLIAGGSGSGKSTLTLQLAKTGWGYLSDDLLLLDRAAGEVEVCGFRRFFAVNQSVSTFAAAEGSSTSEEQYKTKINPDEHFPTGHVVRHLPRTLLFSTVTGEQRSRLSPLTQAETMGRLIRLSPWATYDKGTAKENLMTLAQLARQSGAFDLFAGADLLDSTYASNLLRSFVGNQAYAT